MKLLQDRVAVISGAATRKISDWLLRSFLQSMGLPWLSWTLNGEAAAGCRRYRKRPSWLRVRCD